MKTIWLDMDGTFYNLYGIENWLEELETESKDIFTKGSPLYNIDTLKKVLQEVGKNYNLGIISWTPKECRKTYAGNSAKQKRKWLKKIGLIEIFSEIKIVEYGKDKYNLMRENDILIDDDKRNVSLACQNNRKGILTNGTDLLEILLNL